MPNRQIKFFFSLLGCRRQYWETCCNCEAMSAISDFLEYLLFLNRIAKGTWGKLNVSYFCEPRQVASNGNPFKVNVNVVLLNVSGFLKFSKNLKFSSNFFWYSFLWISVHFQRDIFVARVPLFVFIISREVCIKARSPPTSLPFKGQVSYHTTVKMAFCEDTLNYLYHYWQVSSTSCTLRLI